MIVEYIKSPLNYIGAKSKILKRILPLMPEKIDNFIDLFAGGGNVGINVLAKKVHFNDNLLFLIEMFKEFEKLDISFIIDHIEKRISEFDLSLTNNDGYLKMRSLYNEEKHPLDLFVLIAFSFNHQIRFNNNHQFNNPFGKNRSCFNYKMKENLEKFVIRLQQMDATFSSVCFSDFDFSELKKNDYVYCDPPYLITTGTYNDGKRGFKGWTEKEEIQLLNTLDKLNKNKVKFGLSNVIEHKGKTNNILKTWLENNPKFKIHYIDYNYSNSNYQTIIRDRDASKEVFITNY
jgi:DNA adenine methylase